MDLSTVLTNLYGILLALILKGVSCAYTACNAGTYNDYGTCEPCTICPGPGSGENINDWIVDECVDADVDCLRLCRLPSAEWQYVVGQSFCDNFGKPPTTKSPTTTKVTTIKSSTAVDMSTTLETTTTGTPLMITTSRAISGAIPPGFEVNSGEQRNISNTTIWILGILTAAVAILLVLLFISWYRRRPKRQRQSLEELRLLENDVIEGAVCTSTRVSVTCKSVKNPLLYIELMRGDIRVTRKAISENVIYFGIEEGVRSKTAYTLQVCSYHNSTMDGAKDILQSVQATTDDLIIDIVNSSSTSISAKLRAIPGNFKMVLYEGNSTVPVSEKYIDAESEGPMVVFTITDGILPKKMYTLTVMELSHETGWTEAHTIETPDLFQASANPVSVEYRDEYIQLHSLPSDLSSRHNCYVTCRCDCINNGKPIPWRDVNGVFKTLCSGFNWSWLQVSVSTGTDITTNHVVGETWIQRTGPEVTTPKCTCKFIDADQDIIKPLENVFSQKKESKNLRKALINIGNSLSNCDKPFKDALLDCSSGATFIDEYLQSFIGSDVNNVDIYTLLERLLVERVQASDFVRAILPHHDCAKCKALVHRILHETGHPSVSDSTATTSEETTPTSSHIYIDLESSSASDESNGSPYSTKSTVVTVV